MLTVFLVLFKIYGKLYFSYTAVPLCYNSEFKHKNRFIMSKITPLDRLFVTVTQNGVSRMFTDITGVTSFCDIINCMRARIPGLSGLATVSVRNRSEGWTSTRSILLR